MAYTFRHTSPKLAGVIIEEAVKCGKQNCRCVQGKKHGGYYYLYWREPSDNSSPVLKKQYIKREDAKGLAKSMRRIKEEDKMLKQSLRNNDFLLKHFFQDQ